MKLGYAIISEEHPPERILRHARLAAEAGFDYLSISDHFHPWLAEQGESPFVWNVLGALSQVSDLPVITQVVCPIHRYHPAVVAQAAATSALMAPGGFTLGLGTGEALNEHVVGGAWPAPSIRLDMLEEATDLIVRLLAGEHVTHHGRYFTVDRALLYTRPESAPNLGVAAGGPRAARLAARFGHLIATAPDGDLVMAYREAGGQGHVLGQATLCYDVDPERARQRMRRHWRQSMFGWKVNTELPTPASFEAVSEHLTPDDVVGPEPVGPDATAVLESIETYAQAGFDHVSLHQVGNDHAAFLEFAAQQLLPRVRGDRA